MGSAPKTLLRLQVSEINMEISGAQPTRRTSSASQILLRVSFLCHPSLPHPVVRTVCPSTTNRGLTGWEDGSRKLPSRLRLPLHRPPPRDTCWAPLYRRSCSCTPQLRCLLLAAPITEGASTRLYDAPSAAACGPTAPSATHYSTVTPALAVASRPRHARRTTKPRQYLASQTLKRRGRMARLRSMLCCLLLLRQRCLLLLRQRCLLLLRQRYLRRNRLRRQVEPARRYRSTVSCSLRCHFYRILLRVPDLIFIRRCGTATVRRPYPLRVATGSSRDFEPGFFARFGLEFLARVTLPPLRIAPRPTERLSSRHARSTRGFRPLFRQRRRPMDNRISDDDDMRPTTKRHKRHDNYPFALCRHRIAHHLHPLRVVWYAWPSAKVCTKSLN